MPKSQRLSVRLAVALLAVSASLLAAARFQGPLAAPVAHASCDVCTGTWYGAQSLYTNESINNGIWPQAPNSNACGVETAVLMINYDDNNKGQPMAFTNSSAQTTVESNNRNQSSGASQWGYASPRNNWAGYTNIANDFGTDPRSVEYMAWNYTIANTFYHNYLYRVDLDVPPPPGVVYSFSDQQLHAMTLLAMALEAYNEPVGVPINGGQHIVGVTGVWSGNDPATNYPAQIQGLVYRDPEGDVNSSRQEIDYSVWASGNYGNPFGTYSLWSLYYGDLNHVGDGQNTTDDPEPIVGPYAPHRFFPYHWYHGFNWIRLDNNYSNGQWAPDWAYNAESGAKMTTP